jgi:hypothetical protein
LQAKKVLLKRLINHTTVSMLLLGYKTNLADDVTLRLNVLRDLERQILLN